MATGFNFATAPNNGSIFGSKPAAPSTQQLSFGIGNATIGLGGALSGNTVGNTNQSSLFSASNTNTVASLGAPSINTNKLPTTTGATITVATKFVELPEDFQKEIERIETAIQSQIQECTSITDRSVETVLDEVIKETSAMKRVDCVNKDLTDLKSVLKRDLYYIDQLKVQVAKEMRHSNLISKYVDSSQSNQTFKILTNDQYSSYFDDFTSDLESRMTQCRQQIEELEFHVRNTSIQQLNPSGIQYLIVVQDVLRNQYNAFLSIASKVATCHEKVEKCQKPFEEFERSHGIKPSTSSSQHNYSEMASLLVPSSGHMSIGGAPAAGQFAPNSSAFGAPPSNSFGTLTNSTFGTSAFNKLPANNLKGNQTTSAPIFGANPTTNITQTTGIFGNTSAPTGTASTGSVNTPFNSFGNFGGLSVKRTSST